MSQDKKIIEEMMRILTDAKQKMQEAQKGIERTAISLEVDVAYDGIYEAEEQLLKCMGSA